MKRSIYYLILVCFSLYFFSLSIIGSTLAKYTNASNFNESPVVAVMANDLSTNLNVVMSGSPGSEPTIIPITLINKKNDIVCEVDQKFTISINNDKTAQNIPLVYELYSDASTTKKLTKNTDGIYESDDFKFEANTEEEKVFYLKISWPAEENNESYAFEVDYLTLNIKLNQI